MCPNIKQRGQFGQSTHHNIDPQTEPSKIHRRNQKINVVINKLPLNNTNFQSDRSVTNFKRRATPGRD